MTWRVFQGLPLQVQGQLFWLGLGYAVCRTSRELPLIPGMGRAICCIQEFLSSRNNLLPQVWLWDSSLGKMLYVSGEIISNDLDKNLVSKGYNVKRVVNYTSKPNHQLDETFIEKLRSNMPDIVYVYSQNSALSFLKLINNYKLNDFWMNTNLMCISEKTSAVLNKIKWRKIFIFSPGEEEFLLYKI